jgi:hypothetical protein
MGSSPRLAVVECGPRLLRSRPDLAGGTWLPILTSIWSDASFAAFGCHWGNYVNGVLELGTRPHAVSGARADIWTMTIPNGTALQVVAVPHGFARHWNSSARGQRPS